MIRKYLLNPITIVSVAIIAFWFCSPWIIQAWILWLNKVGNYSDFGTFGDMFGTINALFSGLTIAGLLYTIFLQRKEMSNAQAAGMEQKKLAEDQIDLLKKQVRRAAYQRYEETFLSLIQLHLRHFDKVEPSLAGFEKNNIVPMGPNNEPNDWKSYYVSHLQQQVVIKNYGNYLLTFRFIVGTIQRKTEHETRKKYYRLYFAQLHVDEKRFLLYHFAFGKLTKPEGWEELREYLFEGFSGDHIHHLPFRDFLMSELR